MSDRGADIWVGGMTGLFASLPWMVACIGWAAHWNAYINLLLTLGGLVLWAGFYSMCRTASWEEERAYSALQRLVADLETNCETGAPEYAHVALRYSPSEAKTRPDYERREIRESDGSEKDGDPGDGISALSVGTADGTGRHGVTSPNRQLPDGSSS